MEDTKLDKILKKISKKIVKDTEANFKPYKSLVRMGAIYAQKINKATDKDIRNGNLDTWVKALFQCNNQIIKAHSGNIDLRFYVDEKSNLGDNETINEAINYEQFYQINFTDFNFIKNHLKFNRQDGFTFDSTGLTLHEKGTSKADELSDTLYRITSHLTGYLRYLYNNPGDIKYEEDIEIKSLKNSKGEAAYKMYGKRRHYKTQVTYPSINVIDYINFKFSSQKDKESIIHPYYSETEDQKGSYFSYAWLREHSLEIGRENVDKNYKLYDLVRQTFLQKMDHVPAARIGDVPGEKSNGENKRGSTQVKAEHEQLMSYSQIKQMVDAFLKMNEYVNSDEKLEQLIEIYYNTNTKFQMTWKNLTNVIKEAEEDIINKKTNKFFELLNAINDAKADIKKKDLLKDLT